MRAEVSDDSIVEENNLVEIMGEDRQKGNKYMNVPVISLKVVRMKAVFRVISQAINLALMVAEMIRRYIVMKVILLLMMTYHLTKRKTIMNKPRCFRLG